MATVILPKLKWRTRGITKSSVASDKGGHSGNGPKPALHRKHHARARQPAGYPQGVCAAIGFKGSKTDNPCQCGTHHPNAHKRQKVIA